MSLTVEAKDALRIVQEGLPWALQKKVDGRWESVRLDIKGRLSAYELMNKTRLAEGGQWRVLPRPEADKYTEGLTAGLALAVEAVNQAEQGVLKRPKSSTYQLRERK